MNPQTFVLLDQFRSQFTKYVNSTQTKANSDVAIDEFVNQQLPQIIGLAQSVMADGRLDFFELARVITFTSNTVKDSLDIYTKANVKEKLGVVREIIQFLVEQLIPGNSFVKEYALDDANLDGLINMVYGLIVKFRR